MEMTIAPIPRYLLPHKVRLIEKLSSDGWGGKGETLETDINFVRIEPCRSQRFSLGGDIPEVRAKMFFDAFLPCPMMFPLRRGTRLFLTVRPLL